MQSAWLAMLSQTIMLAHLCAHLLFHSMLPVNSWIECEFPACVIVLGRGCHFIRPSVNPSIREDVRMHLQGQQCFPLHRITRMNQSIRAM